MEIWFILALVSAVTSGLSVFTTKVAAERNYDIVLLSTTAITISAFFLSVVVLARGDFGLVALPVLVLVVVNAIGYFAANIFRHRGMQCIDTAVFYPIYKTLTPALAILGGFFIFQERFTLFEWIGLVASLLVPLLLITHAEKQRQKDLWRGLKYLLLMVVASFISTLALKYGAESTENIWLFIMMSDWALVGVGIVAMYVKKTGQPLQQRLQQLTDKSFLILAAWMGLFSATAFSALVFAYVDGPLSIIYTINSLYILIPIILSIIFYNEHWNARKVIAIVLSIAALGLLG